jgi:small-conductance mechanosensitive channel
MKNLTLLLVLTAGLLAGYLIGDYRGKAARESLQKVIATGETLASEREATVARLKTELAGIDEKRRRDLDAVRRDDAARATAWQHSKDDLSNEIGRSRSKLTASDARLKTLVAQRNSARGTEKIRIAAEIARLQQEQAILRKEIEGNACLHTQIPHGVVEALNETHVDDEQ